MNIFNIIGPIMIGPSSSHTAGACRLGRVVNKLADGENFKQLEIELSGSFARTYRGHGTDRALLAGIMGYHSYSEEIRDALQIAKDRGIEYQFIEKDIPDAHPNTARIHYVLENGQKGVVEGASIGGGNIRVDSVNGMRVDFTGENNTIGAASGYPGDDRRGDACDVRKIYRSEHRKLSFKQAGKGWNGTHDH